MYMVGCRIRRQFECVSNRMGLNIHLPNNIHSCVVKLLNVRYVFELHKTESLDFSLTASIGVFLLWMKLTG